MLLIESIYTKLFDTPGLDVFKMVVQKAKALA